MIARPVKMNRVPEIRRIGQSQSVFPRSCPQSKLVVITHVRISDISKKWSKPWSKLIERADNSNIPNILWVPETMRPELRSGTEWRR